MYVQLELEWNWNGIGMELVAIQAWIIKWYNLYSKYGKLHALVVSLQYVALCFCFESNEVLTCNDHKINPLLHPQMWKSPQRSRTHNKFSTRTHINVKFSFVQYFVLHLWQIHYGICFYMWWCHMTSVLTVYVHIGSTFDATNCSVAIAASLSRGRPNWPNQPIKFYLI